MLPTMMMSTLVRRLKKPSTMKIGSAMQIQSLGLELARPGRHHLADAALEPDELADGGEIGGKDHGAHRGDRVGRPAEPDGERHEGEDEQRADDIGRPQAEVRPVEGARHAVLDFAESEHRQGDGAEIERDQVVARDMVAEGIEAERRRRRRTWLRRRSR